MGESCLEKLILCLESIFGRLFFNILEALRKIIAKVLSQLLDTSWSDVNAIIVMLVLRLFHGRIPLRVSVAGLRFNVRWPSSDLEVLDEVIKKKSYCLIHDFEPKKGDVVIDLGAHIGAYTIYATKRGAQVIAVEPASTNLKLLLQNILLNRVDRKVRLLKVAVGGSRGHVNFPIESIGLNLGNFSLNRIKNIYTKYEKVPLVTLNDVVMLTHIDRLDLVKVDIEGSEKELLQGALKIMKYYKPRLVFEVHGNIILRDLLKELRSLNYVISYITPVRNVIEDTEGDLYYLYAEPLNYYRKTRLLMGETPID